MKVPDLRDAMALACRSGTPVPDAITFCLSTLDVYSQSIISRHHTSPVSERLHFTDRCIDVLVKPAPKVRDHDTLGKWPEEFDQIGYPGVAVSFARITVDSYQPSFPNITALRDHCFQAPKPPVVLRKTMSEL